MFANFTNSLRQGPTIDCGLLLGLPMSKFADCRNTTPRDTSLADVYAMLTRDVYVQSQTELYRRLRLEAARAESMDQPTAAEAQSAQADRAKASCPLFSPAVVLHGGRRERDVAHYTGFSLCDFDDVPADRLDAVWQAFTADEHTLLCYRTISGQGLRVVYAYRLSADVIDRLNRPQGEGGLAEAAVYRAAFYVGNRHYSLLAGGLPFDRQCSNPTRLSYVAHDPRAFLRRGEARLFDVADDALSDVPRNTHLAAPDARPGRPRRVRHVLLDDVMPHLERYMQRLDMAYVSGQRHNYLLKALYQLNRWGVSPDEARAWADSVGGDLPEAERDDVVRAAYVDQHDEHGSLPLPRQRKHALADDQQARLDAEGRRAAALIPSLIVMRHNQLLGKLEFQWLLDAPDLVDNPDALAALTPTPSTPTPPQP